VDEKLLRSFIYRTGQDKSIYRTWQDKSIYITRQDKVELCTTCLIGPI
jgi:hypothetical protein